MGLKSFLYGFARRPVGTSPGTGNFAFQPFTTLPKYSPGGTGITYMRGMNAIQEPQTEVKDAALVDGFNGLAAGDIDLTGLVNLDEAIAANVFNPPVADGGEFRP